MKYNNKGQIAVFIVMIVTLFMALIVFVEVMPIGLPFLNQAVVQSSSPIDKFLYLAIPTFTFIAIIIGGIFR